MKFTNDIQMRSQTIPHLGMSIEHAIAKHTKVDMIWVTAAPPPYLVLGNFCSLIK
jgi:hypothetical protein